MTMKYLVHGLVDPGLFGIHPDLFRPRARVAEALSRWEGLCGSLSPLDVDKEGSIPRPILDRFFEEGLFSLTVPEAYGGLGCNTYEFCRTVTLLARYDSSLTFTAGPHLCNGVKSVALLGSEAQKRDLLGDIAKRKKLIRFALTEASTGSDVANHKSVLEFIGDGSYRLTGGKRWITNVLHAGAVIVCAKCPGLSQNPEGSVYVLVRPDDPGFKILKVWRKLGTRGSNTVDLAFEGILLPRDRILGEFGQGMQQHAQVVSSSRLGAAAAALGLTMRAVRHADAWAASGWIAESDPEYAAAADAVTTMEAVIALTAYALEARLDGAEDGIAAAKFLCTEAASACIQSLYRLAARRNAPALDELELLLREVGVYRIIEGPNEILTIRSMLNLLASHPPRNGLAEIRDRVSPAWAEAAGRFTSALGHFGALVRDTLEKEKPLTRKQYVLDRINRLGTRLYACLALLLYADKGLAGMGGDPGNLESHRPAMLLKLGLAEVEGGLRLARLGNHHTLDRENDRIAVHLSANASANVT
jgi:acyl-CoA dehydrogenase